MPDVSVIVPTFNRLARLQRVLAALEAQTFPRARFEVIVVADGTSDGTDEYLRAAPTSLDLVPVVSSDNQGPATARNTGIARARGEIVLFLDDDVVPGPGLIAEHVRTHESLGARIGALGPMLTPPEAHLAPWVCWEQAMLSKQYDDMLAGRWQPTARQFYTGNTSLALTELRAVGGFDPDFRRAEDMELAYRLSARGVRFVFVPAAVGYHYADRSFRSWLQTAYVYGRSEVVFSRDLGQAWLLPRVGYEFLHNRNPLIRGLTGLCLDRPAASRIAVAALRFAARAGSRLGDETVPRWAYSGMFNLNYYQGIADELGGRRAFFASLAGAAQAPVPGVLEENPSIEWQAR